MQYQQKNILLILKAKSLTRLLEAPLPEHILMVTSINFFFLQFLEGSLKLRIGQIT